MEYKKFAIKLAKKAGKEIRKNFVLGMKKEWKADNSPVTETDFEINQLVIGEVGKHYPGHAVLGEEASQPITGAEYVWVCDPVDGTVPFSHGFPTFTFSLGLVKNGVSILGVIYDPILKRLFFAEKGKGALLNGESIKVNNFGLAKGSVAFWESKTMSGFKAKYPEMKIANLYSICYEGTLVACGQMVAAYYSNIHAHDIAALKVIVEEAGGKVTDKNGKEQRYDTKINGALISNGFVHKELLEFIKELPVRG